MLLLEISVAKKERRVDCFYSPCFDDVVAVFKDSLKWKQSAKKSDTSTELGLIVQCFKSLLFRLISPLPNP